MTLFDEDAIYYIEGWSTVDGLDPDDYAAIRGAARVLPLDEFSTATKLFPCVTNRHLLELPDNANVEAELLCRVHDARILIIWDESTWFL